jgi:transcription-repair coupling factor (superfamily II helicase)
MLDFHRQRFNVLLCTTIIESGIDIPNANTIIINRADRSAWRSCTSCAAASAARTTAPTPTCWCRTAQAITADAQKRLEAIASMDELGAGFTLATHDLEIRGAGELLGEEQSGQITEVGFSLYTELLERAVRSIKQGKVPDLDDADRHGADVELHVPALIPDDYLPDVHARLTLYKRIARDRTRDSDALRELQVEMIDRFGLLPDPGEGTCSPPPNSSCDATALGIRKLDLRR